MATKDSKIYCCIGSTTAPLTLAPLSADKLSLLLVGVCVAWGQRKLPLSCSVCLMEWCRRHADKFNMPLIAFQISKPLSLIWNCVSVSKSDDLSPGEITQIHVHHYLSLPSFTAFILFPWLWLKLHSWQEESVRYTQDKHGRLWLAVMYPVKWICPKFIICIKFYPDPVSRSQG